MKQSKERKELKSKQSMLSLGYLIIVLLGLCALALAVGPARDSMIDLFSKDPADRRVALEIIFRVRLPRIILSMLTGAALSVSGVAFQSILRNPLADPFILGVSGGALFGTLLFSISGAVSPLLLTIGRPFSAFLGAALTLIFLIYISRIRGKMSSTSLLLTGVIINSFFTALILFFLTFTEFSRIQSSFFWIAGAIGSPDYASLAFIAIMLFSGFVILISISGALNVLSLGESTAFSLGVDVERVKLLTIISASLMTAAAVSFAGLIGFVGLMIPHIVRLIVGPDNKTLLLNAFIGGALFLLLCDTLGRTIVMPSEIPAGIITALAGCPFFIWLFLKEKGEKIEID